jgi:octaprenyl-diphosphate synthase
VQPYLQQVETVIQDNLYTDSEQVRSLLKHVSQFAGKRLRPAMVAFAGQALNGFQDDLHPKVGAIVELIHMATLLHDDVLDQAQTRRRVETINSSHGNHVPILLGDFVYANAFTLANKMEDGMAARVLSEVTARICTGEIHQNLSKGRLDLPLTEYYSIIEDKTASLYASCCKLGAYYASASPQKVEALEEYGRQLGIAFQIIDDCLDLSGDESRVGKSLGTDLDGRKMTLPVIYLIQDLNDKQREDFRELWEDRSLADRRSVLRNRFDVEAVVRRARATADEFVSRGLAQLEILPETPARDALRSVGEYVLARDR